MQPDPVERTEIASVLRPPARGVLVCEDGLLTSKQVEHIKHQWDQAMRSNKWPIILCGRWRWLDVDEVETVDA